MGLTVVGIVNTTSEAEHALDQLIAAGFLQNNFELVPQSSSPIRKDKLVPDPLTNESGLPTEKLLNKTAIVDIDHNTHTSPQLD